MLLLNNVMLWNKQVSRKYSRYMMKMFFICYKILDLFFKVISLFPLMFLESDWDIPVQIQIHKKRSHYGFWQVESNCLINMRNIYYWGKHTPLEAKDRSYTSFVTPPTILQKTTVIKRDYNNCLNFWNLWVPGGNRDFFCFIPSLLHRWCE